MTDDAIDTPNRPSPPARQPGSTEHLWAIRRGGRQFDCELLDHGTYGVEVRCLRDLEWFYGHRCETRELAIAEAEERKALYLGEGGILIG